jgi:hypothetical protein
LGVYTIFYKFATLDPKLSFKLVFIIDKCRYLIS